MTLSKKILTLGELTHDEFSALLDLSLKLKQDLKEGIIHDTLRSKTLVMIFQKPSTRTRISFEVGMHQLGGHALNLAPGDMQLSRGETLEDTARTISRYADCMMARVYKHSQIETLANNASIPTINGLSDTFHPCQALADFLTIQEHKGDLQKVRIAWIGDGNNVCNSLIYGSALAGSKMTIATPESLQPSPDAVRYADRLTEIQLTKDPTKAVKDADVVITDTFKSIHDAGAINMDKLFPAYQVNDTLMSLAKPDAIFMHCLPATRGVEVAESVLDGPQSVVWDEAENRLHSQKALLVSLV